MDLYIIEILATNPPTNTWGKTPKTIQGFLICRKPPICQLRSPDPSLGRSADMIEVQNAKVHAPDNPTFPHVYASIRRCLPGY